MPNVTAAVPVPAPCVSSSAYPVSPSGKLIAYPAPPLLVGGIGVAVGGIGVAVGGIGVAVGAGAGVAVGVTGDTGIIVHTTLIELLSG
jgi:hypothetical protein